MEEPARVAALVVLAARVEELGLVARVVGSALE